MNQIFFFLFQIICILIYNDLMAIPGAFWFNAVPKVSNRPNPIWSHLWGGGGGVPFGEMIGRRVQLVQRKRCWIFSGKCLLVLFSVLYPLMWMVI